MHFSGKWFFCLPLLANAAVAKPIEHNVPLHTQITANLVKRVGLGPSAYPYGQAGLNEFSWEGWDPTDNDQKADAVKIHNAYNNDWTQMIYFALQEADAVSDTFKRWFDAGDAQNVKNVLQKMFDPSGVGQPTTLMQKWVCEQEDVAGQCKPGRNAYSVSNKGQFHFCPAGLAQPNANDLKCSDLDAFPSAKMKSVAFTMLHESTHWTEVGDAALGKHITDKANGASDCINLSAADKLINAQNYAFLGAEAYFKRKQCTFTDPPPGTKDADDDNNDESISPTTYAPGWCGIHVIQYQKNEPGDSATSNSPDYILNVCVFDADQVLLNQYPGGEKGDCGEFVAPNGARQPIDTALPGLLYITAGAVDSDPILFNYQDQAWGSNDQPHHSNFGAYDHGSRNGNTGFSC